MLTSMISSDTTLIEAEKAATAARESLRSLVDDAAADSELIRSAEATWNSAEDRLRAARALASQAKPKETPGELAHAAGMAGYVRAAATESDPNGAEAELLSELGIPARGVNGGVNIPLAMLGYARADAPTGVVTGGPVDLHQIVPRIFRRRLSQSVGVMTETVGYGSAEWWVLTSGGTAAVKAEGAVHEATAATFNATKLSPVRLTARYQITSELIAQIGERAEQALRIDIDDQMGDQMETQIFTGNGTSPNVAGFNQMTATPSTNPTTAPTFAQGASLAAAEVDGLWADSEQDVTVVMRPELYRHLARTYQTNDGLSALAGLRQNSRDVLATAFLPAYSSNIGNHLIYKGNHLGASLSAVWPAVELIRDPYTDAASGKISLTAILLWAAKPAHRPNAYGMRKTYL